MNNLLSSGYDETKQTCFFLALMTGLLTEFGSLLCAIMSVVSLTEHKLWNDTSWSTLVWLRWTGHNQIS